MINNNIILSTDSYKASHFLQYPEGTENVYSYIESRGGRYDRTLFFGLQMFLQDLSMRPVTQENVEEAKEFFAAHGLPFNEDGWYRIVSHHGGNLPIRIRAVPEGLVVPTGNVLVTVENTDPLLPWLTSYMETAILRAVWYPTTVATQSWHIKQVIRKALEETSDDPGQVAFKLHDFGARGVSSSESAALGGAAHLVNFMGSDTVEGVLAARNHYAARMAGFSIPAAEHSTITSWGRDGEVDAYRNMLRQFAKPGSLVAIVSDSYDLYNAVDNIWGDTLRQDVIDSGAVVVIRPDSGNPRIVPVETIHKLALSFGTTTNSKGFKVLNNVRVIQGDGIDQDSITDILRNMKVMGYAADNIAFGMGGALLQGVNRDTQRFAMKASAIKVKGAWRDIYKDPVTDTGKRSKRGRHALIREDGKYETVAAESNVWRDMLQTVFEDGEVKTTWTFDQVREHANREALD